MKTLITFIFILAAFLASCSDDNNVNNNNNNQSDIIFSQNGLIDSIYNTTGSTQFDITPLDTIEFSNYNNINIKLKLNGFGTYNYMYLYVMPCDTCSLDFFYQQNIINTEINIDTTIQSPENGAFGVFTSAGQLHEWVSVRDLVIRKID